MNSLDTASAWRNPLPPCPPPHSPSGVEENSPRQALISQRQALTKAAAAQPPEEAKAEEPELWGFQQPSQQSLSWARLSGQFVASVGAMREAALGREPCMDVSIALLLAGSVGSACALRGVSAPPFTFLTLQESLNSLEEGSWFLASMATQRQECSCSSAARSHPLPLFKGIWKRCPESKGE